MSEQPAPPPPSSRGPAPPLPEKPPSVAERTRQLRSSFRKEDGEKPKVPEKPRPNQQQMQQQAPSASSGQYHQQQNRRSNGSLSNGERSPSPPAAPALSQKPPVPEKGVGGMAGGQAPLATFGDSNRDVNGRPPTNTAAPAQVDNATESLNAAKRDAFFRTGGSDGPTTKFDPTGRYGGSGGIGGGGGGGHDRERLIKKEDSAPASYDMDKGDRERERKYGAETRKELEGYVGFANLPNQVYRKSVKRGFEFTLMVVGESGLGKSTLINSLFLTDLYSAEYPGPSHRIQKTVKVDTTQVTLKENGVQLRLTIVDTPGFGDAVDNSNCWSPVTDFIDSKYEEFLNAESRVNRNTTADTRVHSCLYFIAPTGHGLKPLDVEFMKRLHDKVNIIPLIAKADTLTPDECREFKKTILNEIAQHKIRIYEFPDCEDEEEMKVQRKLRDRVPFAVVGSNRVIEVGGKRVRGRQYPWGIVEVENLEHNDFIALRNMVIRTHMQDLKDVTNNVHYENFRYNKLAPSGADGNKIKSGSLTKDPLSQMAEERAEHNAKMKKMEAEMEQVFEMKVKEKKQKLKDSEADLQKRSEQMKKGLEQQQKELSDKWEEFKHDKTVWEEQWGERRRSLENQKDKKTKKGLF